MNVGIGTSMRQFDYAYAHRLIDCIACRQTLAGDRISEWQGTIRGLITSISDCCARAANGHAPAAPPNSAVKSPRFIAPHLPRSPTTATAPLAPDTHYLAC